MDLWLVLWTSDEAVGMYVHALAVVIVLYSYGKHLTITAPKHPVITQVYTVNGYWVL